MSRRRHLAKAVQQERAGAPVPPAWHSWVVAAAIPLFLCAGRLNQDFWQDEIRVQEYASKPWATMAAADYSANNSVFYSLLLKPVLCLPNLEFILRLPSFLFALGTLAMVFRLVRRWAGVADAMSATFTVGLTQVFLIQTMQVQGCGLSMFLAAWLGDLALEEREPAAFSPDGPSDDLPKPFLTLLPAVFPAPCRRWTLIAVVGGLFLYTLPTNLLVFVSLAAASVAWQGLVKRDGARQKAETSSGENADDLPNTRVRASAILRPMLLEASAWVAACLFAAALYFPFREQFRHAQASGQELGPRSSLLSGGTFLYDALRDWLPILLVVVAGAVFWILRCVRSGANEDVANGEWRMANSEGRMTKGPRARHSPLEAFALPIVLLPAVLLPFLLAGLFGLQPSARGFCPVLPFLGATLGWLTGECVAAVQSRLRWGWSQYAVALAGMALLALPAAPALWTYPARLTAYRRTHHLGPEGYYTFYAANYHPADLAAWLKQNIGPTEDYTICFADADGPVLKHYLSAVGASVRRITGKPPGTVYLVTTERPDYKAISKRWDIAESVLRGLPLARDFGYYRVYCVRR